MENVATSTETTDGRVMDIVHSVIPDSVYVVEIVVRGRQGSRVVDVYLDADQALGIDELASFSRQIGARMEEEDVVRGHYRLNVSSPGADRPLRVPRQFPKHIGRTLEVHLIEGASRKGELVSADSESFTIRVGKDEVRLAFEDVREALVALPW